MPKQIVHVEVDGATLHADPSGLIIAARLHRVLWMDTDMTALCCTYLENPVEYGTAAGDGLFVYNSGDSMWAVRYTRGDAVAAVHPVSLSSEPLTKNVIFCGVGVADPSSAWFYDPVKDRSHIVAVEGTVCGGVGLNCVYITDGEVYCQNMATGDYSHVTSECHTARVYAGADHGRGDGAGSDFEGCCYVVVCEYDDGNTCVWSPSGDTHIGINGQVVGVWFTPAPLIVSDEGGVRTYSQFRRGAYAEAVDASEWQSHEGVTYEWVWSRGSDLRVAMDISGRLVLL